MLKVGFLEQKWVFGGKTNLEEKPYFFRETRFLEQNRFVREKAGF